MPSTPRPQTSPRMFALTRNSGAKQRAIWGLIIANAQQIPAATGFPFPRRIIAWAISPMQRMENCPSANAFPLPAMAAESVAATAATAVPEVGLKRRHA